MTYTPPASWNTFEEEVRTQASYDYSTASFCVRPGDNKILATYYSPDQNKIFLSYVDTIEDLESSNALAANEWEFTGFTVNASSTKTTSGLCTRTKLIATSGGTLLLICYDPGNASEQQIVKCFSSSNGLGTDFSELSTIYTVADPGKSSAYNAVYLADLGTVHELSSGRIAFMSGKLYVGVGSPWNSYGNYGYEFSYSDDSGATWNNVTLYAPTTGFTQATNHYISGIAQFSNYIIVVAGNDVGSYYNSCFYYSDDEGETWNKCDDYVPIDGEQSASEVKGISSDGVLNYMWHNSDYVSQAFAKIYYAAKDVEINISSQNPYDRESFWTDFSPISPDDFSARFQIEGHGYQVFQCRRYTVSDDDSLLSLSEAGELSGVTNTITINSVAYNLHIQKLEDNDNIILHKKLQKFDANNITDNNSNLSFGGAIRRKIKISGFLDSHDHKDIIVAAYRNYTKCYLEIYPPTNEDTNICENDYYYINKFDFHFQKGNNTIFYNMEIIYGGAA